MLTATSSSSGHTSKRNCSKMKRLLRAASLAIVTSANLIGSPANAELSIPETTGELYAACLKTENNKTMYGEDLFYGGYCLGLINAWQFNLGRNCIFQKDDPIVSKADLVNVSMQALVQAFINYARDNPQDWSLLALGGLSRAFQQYFPCTNNQG